MKALGQPNASFAGDRGEPDEGVRASIEAVTGDVSYARAIAALCGSRLLLPIAEDPEANLSAVMMRSGSGKTGLLVFTGIPFALTGGVAALWLRDIPLSISPGWASSPCPEWRCSTAW